MRHNPRVSSVPPRPRPGRRISRVFCLLTALFAFSSLVWGMAPAALAAAPLINKPAEQVSTAGVAITPVTVTGENMGGLKAVGLPEGLSLTPVSETEATISG